jgi:hypothetical protein
MTVRSVSWAPKPEILQAISPDAVGEFLVRRGWVRKPSAVALMRRYEHPERFFTDGERMFYVFPDIDTSDDYPDCVIRFIENFARYYELDPQAILAELQGGPVAEPVRTSVSA